jgi:hypothetical protein
LSTSGTLKWTKRVHAPESKQKHKLERVEFARAFIDNNELWCKTIFTDEKTLIWTVHTAISTIGMI